MIDAGPSCGSKGDADQLLKRPLALGLTAVLVVLMLAALIARSAVVYLL